jgi:hypothetical protein
MLMLICRMQIVVQVAMLYLCCCCCADGKFACTFCGAQVAMTQQQRIAQAQQPPHTSSTTTDTAGDAGSAAAGDDDATAKAIAFKDRLVDYDRHSQKRTTVIDDQSDYFEIDTNAWLSEEVRVRTAAAAAAAAGVTICNSAGLCLRLYPRLSVMLHLTVAVCAADSMAHSTNSTLKDFLLFWLLLLFAVLTGAC